MLLDFLPLPRSLMTAPKCMGCSVGKTDNLSLFPIPYLQSVRFSFLPTHLRVLFKAFDERYCQTCSEKTKSLYQQALPCPLDDPLLQRVHESLLQAPHFPIVAYMFLCLPMRFFTFFFMMSITLFCIGCWGCSYPDLPARDIPPMIRSRPYTQ